MSPTEEQATRQHSSEEREDDSSERQEQDSSERHQGRGDADDDQREQRSDEGEDEEQEDQEDEEDEKPDRWKRFATALPLIFGVGFCVAFFVWVCLQMAGQTVGGPPLLVGIFGGSILGIAAAGVAMGIGRLSKD
jgi:hypothetical protein